MVDSRVGPGCRAQEAPPDRHQGREGRSYQPRRVRARRVGPFPLRVSGFFIYTRQKRIRWMEDQLGPSRLAKNQTASSCSSHPSVRFALAFRLPCLTGEIVIMRRTPPAHQPLRNTSIARPHLASATVPHSAHVRHSSVAIHFYRGQISSPVSRSSISRIPDADKGGGGKGSDDGPR